VARTRTSAGLRAVGCGLLGLLAGCARQATVAGIEPLPAVEEAAAAPDTLPADVTEDSAADRRALEALAELEFGSLDRRSEHVRGQLMTHLRVSPSDVADESGRLFNGGHGGAASVAAPTFDINVESFANHDRVQYYMDFFLGPARDRFTIWLGRLSRYEGMIRDRLRQQGVPEDLVYLALIESGYSNTAVSRASAVGMWQFVSGTGRRYGLAVDTWVDERRDPFKATDAAARHLAELNEQFGSWYLAAAAYNAGAGRVTRGLKRLPAGNESLSDSTFFELSDGRYLRRETRDYVPKLIAAALIAKEPARYGFDSLTEMAPLEFDEVTITAATGLDVLARLADTTTRALVELNPHFFRGVTPPNRTVIVRVPRGTGPTVARRWTELPPSERVSFLEHRVARGETLSQIAKRYGVSTSLLQAANPGVKPTRLRIGQRLTVPVSAAARRDASRGQPLPRIVPVTAAARPTRYTVRAGDSLWRIAQRYGLRVSDLRAWNGIGEEQVLRVGERLRLAAP
jgi:membrane-bound lytic murein transglycosylase D